MTEGIATVVNLVDMAATGYEVVTTGYDAYKEIGALKDVLNEHKDIGSELERLSEKVKGNPEEAMADFMEGVANVNPCTRARRCSLVPKSQANLMGGQGCCPGQTGHHLIPDAAVKDAGCPGYDSDKAPTVCAEGTSHGTGGSHGALHGSLERRMKDFQRISKKSTMSYAQYRNEAIGSFYETFPESKCDRKRLKAQLDSYYKCNDKSLKAVSGKGRSDSGDF